VAIPFRQLEGKYEILEKMSEGGMGAVYKVRHRLLDEIRVIKVMRPHLAEDEVLRKRFVREAKTAIRLRHANLAQVYDFTMDDSGYFFLAMEFIDGIDLHGLAKLSHPVPLGIVLELASQSLDVIGYLHRKEIVHRDISPDNLLISRDDENNLLVKLIDLGIAKVEDKGGEHLTATGTFLGKVKYSSPEQFKGEKGHEVDARSDLYSFGVVLYELLTGVYPIKGNNISSLISGHLIHPPESFKTTDPEGRVPVPLRAIVLKALAKEPGERFQCAADFLTELDKVRAATPIEPGFLDRVFEEQRAPTARIPVKKPGSTQGRLDQNFGIETTPAQGERTAPELVARPRPSGSGTEVLPEGQKSGHQKSDVDLQIRALLLGAEKLIEARHFDEARLQLDTAENLAPGQTEVAKLVEVLEKADTAMQKRREKAAIEIEALIRAENFQAARSAIRRLSEELGKSTVLDDLSDAVDQAEQAAEERAKRAAEILRAAAALMEDDQWEDAVPMIREALVLTPDDGEAHQLLEKAERGYATWLEDRRFQAEIEGTAATIEASLAAEDIEGVRRSLKLAEKLYGDHPRFSEFPGKLKDLETLALSRRVETLRAEAADLVKTEDYIAAGLKLEMALDLAPDDDQLKVALKEAAEGRRLKEEEARRRQIIGDTGAAIRRLVVTCRFPAAMALIDKAVDRIGSFEEESSFRQTVKEAAEIHEATGRRIDALVAEVHGAVEAKHFERAQTALDAAREIAESYPEALDAVDELIHQLQTAESRYRRAMDIKAAATSIEKRLKSGHLDSAMRELDLARRLYGTEAVFDDLAVRLVKARHANERDSYRRKINDAQERGAPFQEVLDLIEAALAFDPGDETFQELLSDTRRAEKADAEAKLRPAILEVLEDVDHLIAGGRDREALSVLETAVEELGSFPEARALRHRLKCSD
jgi:serine/threonine-protein kinase